MGLEDGWPLEAEKVKEIDSPLEPPTQNMTLLKTLILAQ